MKTSIFILGYAAVVSTCAPPATDAITITQAFARDGSLAAAARLQNSENYDICLETYRDPENTKAIVGDYLIAYDGARRPLPKDPAGYLAEELPKAELRVEKGQTADVFVSSRSYRSSVSRARYVSLVLFAYNCDVPSSDRHIVDLESRSAYPELVKGLKGLTELRGPLKSL